MGKEKILLSHGSGGKLMHNLIDTLFLKELGNEISRKKNDSAVINIGNKKIAFTTDSYVVNPIFFPGGDIGSLAIHGTVNDLAVCGARPLYISLGMIIEEGLDMDILKRITASIKAASKRSGIKVVTGDMKVVEKGSCDKIFINSSGIGELYYRGLSTDNIKAGDAIIINGGIGEHAISVLSKREGIRFSSAVKSDSAPLSALITKILKASGKVRLMRDPTRGGVATTLNEIVKDGKFGVSIDEKSIPVKRGVREACELLGFDPLYLACEGRVLIVVAKEDAKKVVNVMKKDALGRDARIIGRIIKEHKARVCLNTSLGGRRIVDMLSGEQLPRIC
ncbi:MAG: hydrogenase expression/formation protein HypE [Candidatus Omnitrophica bacterium]|nr:hydrogenase expression/formation protein HypE [Candidatus Omnitrophota bacterium]